MPKKNLVSQEEHELSNALTVFSQIRDTLKLEMLFCIDTGKGVAGTDAHYAWLRLHLKSFISTVEGETSAVKNLAFMFGKFIKYPFTMEEMAGISEKTYSFDPDGTVKEKNLWPTIQQNMLFSYPLTARVFGKTFAFEKSGNGWRYFIETINLRNKVVHPRTIEDLLVPDEKLDVIADAYQWWSDQTIKFLELVSPEILRIIAPIRSKILREMGEQKKTD